MPKLDRPLFGDYATGTFARVLAFRHTANPPDAPGEHVVYLGTVTQLPASKCPPSAPQAAQRAAFSAALLSWRALSIEDRAFWLANHPTDINGFNFYIRSLLAPGAFFFGFCIFADAVFELSSSPGQPDPLDYDSLFPTGIDELPTLLDGSHSPQAWLFNRMYQTIQDLQGYIVQNRSTIEA